MTDRPGALAVRPRDPAARRWSQSLRKLDPRVQIRNPVMFVVEIGAVITTVGWLIQVFGGPPLGGGNEPAWFTFTVARLAVADGRLRQPRRGAGRGPRQGPGRRAARDAHRDRRARCATAARGRASELRRGDVVVVEAGEVIPGDGTVIEGIASVDESAITGESAPVIREAGGDRSAVTGGTRVLSDRIVVEITQEPGKSFLDRMIALVEGAERRKTPNEIALNILLAGLTLVFLVVVVTLRPFAEFAEHRRLGRHADRAAGRADPDHDRRAALGDRHRRHGPARAPQRARAVRAARSRPPATSTCCCSTRPARSRSATARRPSSCRCRASSEAELAEAAQMASLADETPEGRSIVVLAKQYGIREHELRRTSATLRPLHGRDAHERRRPQRHAPAQGRRRRDRRAASTDEGGQAAARARRPQLDRIAPRGRHAAGRRARQPGARRHLPQGRRQGGHARALRPAAGDGHPHGHGHRRQPADRGEDRRGVRRRRLPRRGDAGAQARADPRGAGRRAGWWR